MTTVVGLLLLLVRGLLRLVPWRPRRPRPVPAWRAERPSVQQPVGIRVARGLIGGAGVLLIAWGVVVLLTSVSPTAPHYVGLALWLGGAVVLHDAVIVPGITLIRALLLRIGRALPAGAAGLMQVCLGVGGLLTAIAVPELVAQRRGPANPTVLPGDYGADLLVRGAAVVLIVALGIVVLRTRERRAVRQRT